MAQLIFLLISSGIKLSIYKRKEEIKMKIGILGTGFGAYHASIYNNLENVDSIIIFGRNKDKLNKIKENIKVEITDSIEAIINDKDIDLIDICLPSSLHKEYTIEALKKGKHVFCETPVSLTLEDVLEMRKAEEMYCKKVFVNQFIKHEPAYEYIYETIKNNSLGKLKALHIRRKTPQFWGDLSLNNIVINLMMHEFDFITWLLDEPYKITATGVNGKKDQSHVTATLYYKDALVEVQGSSMMPYSHAFSVGYEAVFEDGTIEYYENGYKDREESSLVLFTDSKAEEIKLAKKNCYEESIKHVLKCCENNLQTRLSLDAAVKSLRTALKVKDLIL